ncbi:type 4 pilus major pilin [Asaia krungthepensis]|uniref:Type 4 secretion system PilS N-terminal domain-containing protein n=1 Tax=Asaia krungthepensis NRIC 0535 TaxID=1307925 RepID=A0ABQ0Q4R2_9PROT|nr:type 4 pilus major pilin [Asaia krungthepensis]GBQ91194.1 hypothetical protein AA0535_2235 [Asaia krungthepensis NRIC 0535]
MFQALIMIGALLVGVYLLGQAAGGVNQMFSGGLGNTAVEDANFISTHIKSIYGGSINGATNFSTVGNAEAIRAGAVPSDMLNGDGQTIKAPWVGSTVQLTGSSDGGTFYETWSQVPGSACASLANAQSVNYMNINGTAINMGAGQNVASQVAQACNGTAGNYSSVQLSYVMNFS